MLTLVGKVVDVVSNCKSDHDLSRNVGYIHVESLHKKDPDRIYVEVDGSSPYHSKLPLLVLGAEVTIKFKCWTRQSTNSSGVVFNNFSLVSLSIIKVEKTEMDLLSLK